MPDKNKKVNGNQDGEPIKKKRTKDETLSARDQEVFDWTKDYVESPMYRERLSNFYKYPDYIQRLRSEGLDNTAIKHVPWFPAPISGVTMTNPLWKDYANIIIDDSEISNVINDNPSFDQEVIAHELSHVNNGGLRRGRNLSYAEERYLLDRNKIFNHLSKDLQKDIQEKGKKEGLSKYLYKNTNSLKFLDYYDHRFRHDILPAEQKSNFDAVRFLLKQKGLYDAGTQKMTPALWDKITTDEKNKDLYDSRSFIEMIQDYEDKDIIDILNTVAGNPNKTPMGNSGLKINNNMPDPTKGRKQSASNDDDVARANRIVELSRQWGVPTNQIYSTVQRGPKNIYTGYTPRVSTQYYTVGNNPRSITDRYEDTTTGYSAAAYNTKNLSNADQLATSITPATPIQTPQPQMGYGGYMPGLPGRKKRANFGTSMGWDMKNQYQGYFDWGGAIPPMQHMQDGYMVPDGIDAKFDWGGAIPPNQKQVNGYMVPSNIFPGDGPAYHPSVQDTAAVNMTRNSMFGGGRIPNYWASHLAYGGDVNFPNPTAYFEPDEIPQAENGKKVRKLPVQDQQAMMDPRRPVYSSEPNRFMVPNRFQNIGQAPVNSMYNQFIDPSAPMSNFQIPRAVPMYGLPTFEDGGGLSRSEDYGSKKKPYPSVNKSDFAGGGRSYPIPTKADAIDALRLAGLHGRDDVKAKVYAKYPSLRKADYGIKLMMNGGIIPSSLENYHQSQAQYDPQFAASGIRIKPENRGKFNATKKRTGKTTEELTHSSNPVTRKRAIFAQNASRWNKGEYGLDINDDLQPIRGVQAGNPTPDISLKNTPARVQDYMSEPTPDESTTGRNTVVSNSIGAPSINISAAPLITGLAGVIGQAANRARNSNSYAKQVRQSMMQPTYNPYMSGTGYTNLYQNGGIVPGQTYDLTQDQIDFLSNQGYDIEFL